MKKLDLKNGTVELPHGGGGRAMNQLISEMFASAFSNDYLNQGNDQAIFEPQDGRMVMSTDGFVISPLFFPGGNIGSLAVHGTVNDVALSGAKPLYLSAGFIIEEGFSLFDLERIVDSMAEAAREAEVFIVTGDTKVVERGKGDGVFITTTGVGVVSNGLNLSGDKIEPGDAVLVSGTMGDHGVAIMSKREGLSFETEIQSDCASLNHMIAEMVEAVTSIRCMRDPTRGGLAATLNELAQQSGLGISLNEPDIPLKGEVAGACELLGLDPLNVANEGKLIAVCPAADAEKLLSVMRANPLGRDASIVGEAVSDPRCFVSMKTQMGGTRMVDWLSGEQLPRIC